MPPRIAGFATRLLAVDLGPLTVRLAAVDRLADHVDTTALLRDAAAPEPPYWAYPWAGGRALARLVATAVPCAGRRVVDLGCGLGLAGIAAARRGGRVVLMDREPAAVRFARANARLNGVDPVVVRGDIARPPLRGPVDHCLAADVTYDPDLQGALAAFLAAHLAPDGTGWCVESVRTCDTGFAAACAARGLWVEERTLREDDEGRPAHLRLQIVRR